MLGDHLGAWDFGLFLDLDEVNLSAYRQFPLETKDNLKLKSIQDALTGIKISFKNRLFETIEAVTYEFLYTKHQDGPRRPNPYTNRDTHRGNENYYNHYLYLSGWTYYKRTIGNPLFIQRNNNLGIANNRIVAHHLGLQIKVKETTVVYKITVSRNYGNWGPSDEETDFPTHVGIPFEDKRTQYSSYLSILLPINLFEKDILINTDIAFDKGDLVQNQIGINVGLHLSF